MTMDIEDYNCVRKVVEFNGRLNVWIETTSVYGQLLDAIRSDGWEVVAFGDFNEELEEGEMLLVLEDREGYEPQSIGELGRTVADGSAILEDRGGFDER